MKTRRPVHTTLAVLLGLLQATSAYAGCKVTLKGNYTTPVENNANILVYLNGMEPSNTSGDKHSQVRAKLGTWYKIKGCTWSIRTYSPGDSFTVACSQDFGCGNRRYRLYVRAEDAATGVVINDGFKYYPSEEGWSDNTTIDFGDLGKLLN
jgi:hypothetical protein